MTGSSTLAMPANLNQQLSSYDWCHSHKGCWFSHFIKCKLSILYYYGNTQTLFGLIYNHLSLIGTRKTYPMLNAQSMKKKVLFLTPWERTFSFIAKCQIRKQQEYLLSLEMKAIENNFLQ